MDKARFCAHCGSPLAPDARFCGRCGRPVQAMPAAPSPAAPPMPPAAPAEPIVGIIGLQRQRGFLGGRVEFFNMIVTPQRLALIAVSKQAMNEAIRLARQQARSEGKGFFDQIRMQLGWLQVLYRQYQETPLDLLLQENPGSFALRFHEVRSIRLRGPGGLRVGIGAGSNEEERPEMTIETAAGKQTWTLVNMSVRDARNILEQVLGGVVR